MALNELDVVVRVAGATLLLWFAFASRAGRPRHLFAPLAICLTGFLATNTPETTLRLSSPLGWVAVVLAGYAAVFLWWWCLAVFERRFQPRGLVLGVGLAWFAVASLDRGLLGEMFEDRGLSWVLIGLGLIMVTHLAWRLMRDRANDLIDRRRRARRAVVAVLALQLLADIGVDLAFGLEWTSQAFTLVQNAAILIFICWLTSLELGIDAASAKGQPRASPATDPALEARLRHLIEIERVHLNPALTLDQFVKAMGAPERVVRRLINQQLGHDHFRTFLNASRVEEARRILSDPARREDKLIVVSMDSGFASLPSFNRVFREMEGRTPSAFRDAENPGFEKRSTGF